MSTDSPATPVVLVTGAAGRIGSAVVQAVTGRGATAVLSDAVPAAPGDTGNLAPGARALVIPADVTSDADLDRLVREILAKVGRIDAVVNAAGVEGPIAALEELDVEQVVGLYQVNVFGTLRVIKAVLPHLKHRRSGRIVNLASGAGLVGTEYMSAYSSSKHAVVGLTRSVAREVAEHGISVNAVCPGCVESPMMARIEAELSGIGGRPASFELAIPARRYARPEEVANLIAYLALEAPTYLTGAALVIDGALRA